MTACDPELRRLRALLTLQRAAVDAADWGGYHALAAAVGEELRVLADGEGRANPAALADIAQQHLRLELQLGEGLRRLGERRRQVAARLAYRTHAPG